MRGRLGRILLLFLGLTSGGLVSSEGSSSFFDGISPTELIPNYSANCDCTVIEIVSTRADVLKKHGKLLGRYRRREENVNSRPSYEHFSGKKEEKKVGSKQTDGRTLLTLITHISC